MAEIFIESARTALSEILPHSWLARLSVEDWTERNTAFLKADRHAGFLGEEHGEPVAFALVGPNRTPSDRYEAELCSIFVLARSHRRGWGRALVREVAREVQAQDMRGMVVWTDEANTRGRAFYEHLGGRYIEQKLLDFDGEMVPEVCYAWLDVSVLAT
jgi:hypothetical protein